jgi:hypothetical protein
MSLKSFVYSSGTRLGRRYDEVTVSVNMRVVCLILFDIFIWPIKCKNNHLT